MSTLGCTHSSATSLDKQPMNSRIAVLAPCPLSPCSRMGQGEHLPRAGGCCQPGVSAVSMWLLELEKKTPWGPGCHWDGLLETPRLVEPHFLHRTMDVSKAQHEQRMSTGTGTDRQP